MPPPPANIAPSQVLNSLPWYILPVPTAPRSPPAHPPPPSTSPQPPMFGKFSYAPPSPTPPPPLPPQIHHGRPPSTGNPSNRPPQPTPSFRPESPKANEKVVNAALDVPYVDQLCECPSSSPLQLPLVVLVRNTASRIQRPARRNNQAGPDKRAEEREECRVGEDKVGGRRGPK